MTIRHHFFARIVLSITLLLFCLPLFADTYLPGDRVLLNTAQRAIECIVEDKDNFSTAHMLIVGVDTDQAITKINDLGAELSAIKVDGDTMIKGLRFWTFPTTPTFFEWVYGQFIVGAKHSAAPNMVYVSDRYKVMVAMSTDERIVAKAKKENTFCYLRNDLANGELPFQLRQMVTDRARPPIIVDGIPVLAK